VAAPAKVLGAGFVTWEEGDPTSVVCFGNGKLSVDITRSNTRMVESRGATDTELVKALLAQPLKYVVLRVNGKDLLSELSLSSRIPPLLRPRQENREAAPPHARHHRRQSHQHRLMTASLILSD
jgi:hypothetical protein